MRLGWRACCCGTVVGAPSRKLPCPARIGFPRAWQGKKREELHSIHPGKIIHPTGNESPSHRRRAVALSMCTLVCIQREESVCKVCMISDSGEKGKSLLRLLYYTRTDLHARARRSGRRRRVVRARGSGGGAFRVRTNGMIRSQCPRRCGAGARAGRSGARV